MTRRADCRSLSRRAMTRSVTRQFEDPGGRPECAWRARWVTLVRIKNGQLSLNNPGWGPDNSLESPVRVDQFDLIPTSASRWT